MKTIRLKQQLFHCRCLANPPLSKNLLIIDSYAFLKNLMLKHIWPVEFLLGSSQWLNTSCIWTISRKHHIMVSAYLHMVHATSPYHQGDIFLLRQGLECIFFCKYVHCMLSTLVLGRFGGMVPWSCKLPLQIAILEGKYHSQEQITGVS